jgi:hypothetical protein
MLLFNYAKKTIDEACKNLKLFPSSTLTVHTSAIGLSNPDRINYLFLYDNPHAIFNIIISTVDGYEYIELPFHISGTNRLLLTRIEQIDVIINTIKEYSNLYEYILKNKD